MIRTTHEAPFFGLWRDAAMLRELADPEYLTTARYEPILHNRLGSGHIDLLFEAGQRSCILGAIRLDATHLITRERSSFVWPAFLAAVLDETQLVSIERAISPWLRSISRARPMALESIRRYAASERFDQAREAGLVGAASLKQTIPRMAPFVYGRRFSVDARVLLSCADGALGQAILLDVARYVGRDVANADDQFAAEWYGSYAPSGFMGSPDVIFSDRTTDSAGAAVIINIGTIHSTDARMVDVPSPVPWDLLFSFDSADGPLSRRFGVTAADLPVRPYDLIPPPTIVGGSSGRIVLAVSSEALSFRGDEIEEAEILGERLAAEGFQVAVVSDVNDRALIDADLIHIFGSRVEPHTITFAEYALEREVVYVFDLPPVPLDSATSLENTFASLYAAALDDADITRYVRAFEERNITVDSDSGSSGGEYDIAMARFSELSRGAGAILCGEQDLDLLRASLPNDIVQQLRSRGVFSRAEVLNGTIAHLVPRHPFVFVHGAIARRSHSLYVALAAERAHIPLVVAGPVYDVDYLQAMRTSAPDAIVLADPSASTVSALYRSATIWVDAAPEPRSAARFMRAVACGALPVVPLQSPLSRVGQRDLPTFSLLSIDECARELNEAIRAPMRQAQIRELKSRLLARRDNNATFAAVVAAYALCAAVASN